MTNDWDINMIELIDSNIMDALITYMLKEWYRARRMTDDFMIERTHYEEQLLKIRRDAMVTKEPVRRSGSFW